jgi:hypothetical protein
MQQRKSFARHFFGLWGWLALGAAALAVFLALVGQSGSRTADRLTHEGADAQATVTDKRRSTDSDGDTRHFVRYVFVVGAESFEDRQDVSFALFQRLREGDRIPVRYWTGDPTVSEIERGAAEAVATFGKVGAIIAALVALVPGWIGWKRAANATWMGRHGVPRQVRVEAHVETNVAINDVPQWKATWREADGRAGATRMARQDRLPEIDRQITILVDPEGHRDSMWEGDLA